MKSREMALRLKRFEIEEKIRKVADLEQMIREFEHMAADLERQISAEEERTGVRDLAHFAYSTFAKAASQRRDNLRASVADLRAKHEVASQQRDEALAEVDRSTWPEVREDTLRRRHERGQSAIMR